MNRVWAPWRMEYIRSAREGEAGCLFCRILSEQNDQGNHVVYRGKSAFVMLNKYPYTNGHLMVIPYRHGSSLSCLTAEEHMVLGQLLTLSCQCLTQMSNPHGFNIGMNLGQIAGAGVADHIHYHVVPRWSGDTNFMPVIGDTRVISEGLEAVYHALLPLYQEYSNKQ